jgi:uncharacterized protein YjbJ (UPF0337 family)
MNNDKIEGAAKKAEGSVQSGYGDITGDKVQDIKGKAKKVVGSVQEKLGEAEEFVEESYESVTKFVNDKPMQSALISLGIGIVIGKLLSL